MAAANVLWDAGEGDPTEKRGAMGCYTIGDRMPSGLVFVGSCREGPVFAQIPDGGFTKTQYAPIVESYFFEILCFGS